MSTDRPFSYAVLRVVPRVERGERINVGVILHCRSADFLGVRIGIDEARLAALWPTLTAETIRPHLAAIEKVAAGDPDGGAMAGLPATERFNWLVAPSSTVIQPSETHTGLCDDPATELDHLFETLVLADVGQ